MKKQKYNLIFTFLLISFFLVIQGPNIFNNFNMQGSKLRPLKTKLINTESALTFPTQENSVVLFWATWCAPCKLEMKRLQQSIEDKEIRPSQVYAYNPFENNSTIKKFLNHSHYDFQFIETTPALEEIVPVKATPTYLWLQKNTIYRMTTGISIVNLWWLEFFLK